MDFSLKILSIYIFCVIFVSLISIAESIAPQNHLDVMSKGFQSMNGRAILVSRVYNTNQHPHEERIFMTGRHVIANIECKHCHHGLGWKYIRAFERTQKARSKEFPRYLEFNVLQIVILSCALIQPWDFLARWAHEPQPTPHGQYFHACAPRQYILLSMTLAVQGG